MEMMEEFIRESRMVMLSFYVNNPQIKARASELIEKRTAMTLSQLGNVMSVHEAKTRAIEGYYEMGTRYFKRYAAMNWKMFLTDRSKQRYENIVAEVAVIDEVIYQLQKQLRTQDKMSLAELGQYLMMKVRLEKAIDMIEGAMLNMIESPLFKEKLLPDVVRYFYDSYQKRT